ncbi:MAG: DUF429 domain-containing protein [Methanomicrobiales archaeon]
MKIMIIIGIDLSGKPDNPTGICILNNLDITFKILYSDHDIITEISSFNPDLIVIDAPISLPKGRCCLEKDCSCSKFGGHFRESDIKIRKYGPVLPLTFYGMKMLTKRGINLAERLKNRYDVIETHPRTVQKMLKISNVPDHLKQFFNLRSSLVNDPNLGVSKHELDAALCVITGLYYIKNQYISLGNIDEGLIILPDGNVDMKDLF